MSLPTGVNPRAPRPRALKARCEEVARERIWQAWGMGAHETQGSGYAFCFRGGHGGVAAWFTQRNG